VRNFPRKIVENIKCQLLMFVKERALLHSLRVNKAICNINNHNLSINAVNVSVKLYAA